MAKQTDPRSYSRGYDRGYDAGQRDGLQAGLEAFQASLRAALPAITHDFSTPLERIAALTALIEEDLKIVPRVLASSHKGTSDHDASRH